MDDQYFAGNQNAAFRLNEFDARLVRRDEVMRLLASGRKINAIKVYREDTGASLADAKAAVERMELAAQLSGPGAEPFASFQEEMLPGAYAARNVDMEAVRVEVEDLLRQRKKIEAIKLYRERTGTGLREAKEVVDQIEATLQASEGQPLQSKGDSGDVMGEIEALLRQHKKITAIKVYRERTGAGLWQAKKEVDQIERNIRSQAVSAGVVAAGQGILPEPGEEVRRHLLAGDKIKAIKSYREQTGLGLREAKDEIDRLALAWRSGLE